MAILSQTSKVLSDINTYNLYKLLDNASVDETTTDAIDVRGNRGLALLVEANAGVSGGVVKLEGAVTADYTGTWAELASITTNGANKLFIAEVGLDDATGVLPPFIRARIETVISGGNIDVYVAVLQ